MRLLFAALMLLAWPGAAAAEWHEASSPHFVIYADDSESDIRRFSEQLERYHQAMATITRIERPPPSPSNRVTVFVVANVREVQRLYGEGGRYVGGFYQARAGSTVAFVPKVKLGSGEAESSLNTLLHEYAHHFLISNTAFPSPRWLDEGAAEFFSAVRFQLDGRLFVGAPSTENHFELAYADKVTAEQLLDPAAYETRVGFDSFYGRSWALYHYLTFEPARAGQLANYLRLMMTGKSSRDAALEAFGSFAELDRDLGRYLRRGSWLSFQFEADELKIGAVAVRKLSAGEVAMMPVRMRSRRGVDEKQAAELVTEARSVAARFPGDAAVFAALAEAEYDAGMDAEAIAAADAALAIDPQQVNAYVQKGYALFRKARTAADKDAAYRGAVEPFLALNKIEPDHPVPLAYFYRGMIERGRVPTANAILGLERAVVVAPFDLDLRRDLAMQQIGNGQPALARINLIPIAYAPHGGPMSAGARTLIERIDSGAPPEITEAVEILDESAMAAAAEPNG